MTPLPKIEGFTKGKHEVVKCGDDSFMITDSENANCLHSFHPQAAANAQLYSLAGQFHDGYHEQLQMILQFKNEYETLSDELDFDEFKEAISELFKRFGI